MAQVSETAAILANLKQSNPSRLMSFSIHCSFGEIIDKITILDIKLQKASGAALKAVQTEYNAIKSHLDYNKTPEFKRLLSELRRVNQTLWALEDDIRQMSAAGSFNQDYIKVAESIHKTNDERYRIKKSLNTLVGSNITEEKLYTDPTADAQDLFARGDYYSSLKAFERLVEGASSTLALFYALASYITNCAFLGIENKFDDKIDEIMPTILSHVTDEAFYKHMMLTYGHLLLRRKLYQKATDYLTFMNSVSGPNIHPTTMAYFKPGDTGKTLLVYMGGGLGDKIMFGRFIPRVCTTNSANKVILLCDDNLVWIFKVFADLTNLSFLPYSQRELLNFSEITYHTNIHMLPHYLGLEYKDIYADYYLKELRTSLPPAIEKRLSSQKTVLINWHGNYANQLERINRGMSLADLSSLFSLEGIQFVSTQKEYSPEEAALMKTYNILNLGASVDKDGDAYKDTLAIMRHAAVVISTDTSFVHVAGTADVPCWVMLTRGCEWRWTQDTKTNWYPNLRLFRQKEPKTWKPVIANVRQALQDLLDLN